MFIFLFAKIYKISDTSKYYQEKERLLLAIRNKHSPK